MIVTLLADLVLLLHLGFILFATLGGLLLIRWTKLAWLHLPALCWAAWIAFSGAICPLTPLEQSLRQHAGEGQYSGSFIAYYIEPMVYPAGLTPALQWWLGALLLGFNLLLYLYLFVRWRRGNRLR